MNSFTGPLTKWGRERMEILIPREKVSICGDNVVDYEVLEPIVFSCLDGNSMYFRV
jgi:hypothetical protein